MYRIVSQKMQTRDHNGNKTPQLFCVIFTITTHHCILFIKSFSFWFNVDDIDIFIYDLNQGLEVSSFLIT